MRNSITRWGAKRGPFFKLDADGINRTTAVLTQKPSRACVCLCVCLCACVFVVAGWQFIDRLCAVIEAAVRTNATSGSWCEACPDELESEVRAAQTSWGWLQICHSQASLVTSRLHTHTHARTHARTHTHAHDLSHCCGFSAGRECAWCHDAPSRCKRARVQRRCN